MATYSRMGAYLLAGELCTDRWGGSTGASPSRARPSTPCAGADLLEELLKQGGVPAARGRQRHFPVGGRQGLRFGVRVEGGSAPYLACDYIPGRSSPR